MAAVAVKNLMVGGGEICEMAYAKLVFCLHSVN